MFSSRIALAKTRATALLLPVLFLLATTLSAQDLSPEQQAKLQAANSQVGSAEGDLDAARGSAGVKGNPAKGSRKRLTEMRVSSARPKLDQAESHLSGLPSGNADVAALTKRLEAARQLADEIDEILSGGSTPAPKTEPPVSTPEPKVEKKPDPKPSPSTEPRVKKEPVEQPATEARLDYRQEDALKRARWNLGEAQSYAKQIGGVVQRMDGEENRPVHSEVKLTLETLDRAVQKHGYAVKELQALPGEHSKVAAVVADAQSCADLLGAYRSRLEAENAKLQKLTGMENYPNYNADMELLSDISRRYSNWDQTVHRHEELARVISEDANCVSEVQRIAKIYQPLIDQKTAEGEALGKLGLYCLNKRKEFAAKLTDYKKELPGLFSGHIEDAERISKEAVAEKKPLFFGPDSGIEQQLGYAEEKLIVIRAFGDEVAKPYEDKLAAARARIAERAQSLEAEIIAQNTLPSDRYKGADRDDLIKRATAHWQEYVPGAKVIHACIPGEAWARSTRWEWSAGAFHKIDKSKLQVQLIVVHDDKLAVIRPINLYKYHLENDVIRAFRFDNKEDKLLPSRFIPLSKLK